MRINLDTFGQQMSAAGLAGLPVSWTADGLTYFGDVSDTDRAKVEAVLSAHDPGALPSAVPEIISDRQCFQQLAILGKITQDEALAAVTVGALPKAVTDGIASLPAPQQFPARMLLCGATEFHRSHPMTPAFLAMIGLGLADRDPFWTAAAAL